MIAIADWLIPLLARGSVAMLLAMWIVRMTRPQNFLFRRTACVVVLLHGWLLLPLTIEVPWYDAPDSLIVQSEPVRADAAMAVQPILTAFRDDISKVPFTSATEPVPWNAWQRLRLALFVTWLIGVIGIVVHHARSVYHLCMASCRWRRPPFDWTHPWSGLLSRYGYPESVPMFVSDRHGPMLCRLPGQTCLVVPEPYWSSCDEQERRTVLRHELSHYRNHDVEKSWAMGLLALPYWFHPAAWWSLAEFREVAELRSDSDAVSTLADRSSFLRALGKLVVDRHSTTFVAGHSAHAHPLLLRMRRLTEGPFHEESMMKKCLVSVLMLGLLAVQTFRVELVAQTPSPPLSLQAVEDRMRELDQKIESLKEVEESIQEHGEKLKETVDAKAASLEELKNAPENLSEAAQGRVKLFLSGEEAEQLRALEDIASHESRDEAVLFCGHVADQSVYPKVRQAALQAACSFGKEGYPAIAIAYKGLDTNDRIFLLEQMRSFELDDRAVLMALMSKDASEELMSKLIDEPLDGDRRLVLLGHLAKTLGDDAVVKILKTAETTEGEQGLLVLYSAAKAKKPEHVLKAVQAARKRGPEAYPVIGAAGKCKDPAVRAEVVRAAKAWGGEVGQFIIDKAQQEADETLREAAEKALAE